MKNMRVDDGPKINSGDTFLLNVYEFWGHRVIRRPGTTSTGHTVDMGGAVGELWSIFCNFDFSF